MYVRGYDEKQSKIQDSLSLSLSFFLYFFLFADADDDAEKPATISK
jgi:hypothetical protein